MNRAIFKVPHAPDTSMPHYRRRHGQQAAERAASALGYQAELQAPGHGEVGLRLVFDPVAHVKEARLGVFVWVCGSGQGQFLGGCSPGMHRLREFFPLEASDPAGALGIVGELLDQADVIHVAQAEEGIEVAPDIVYWSPVPFAGRAGEADHHLTLDGLLDELEVPCLIDAVVLATALSQQERQALVESVQQLAATAQGGTTERRDSGRLEDLQRRRDVIADRHRRFLEGFLDNGLDGPLFSFALRVCCPDPGVGTRVANAMGRLVGGDGPRALVRIQASDARHAQAVQAIRGCSFHLPARMFREHEVFSEWLDEERLARLRRRDRAQVNRLAALSRLRSVCGVGVMRALLRLPASDGVNFRTLRLESDLRRLEASLGSEGILLGLETDTGREVTIPTDSLLTHMFATGMTGSGKTTTIVAVLARLRQERGVPWVVLEPAKSEYRQLLQLGGDWARDLRVFTAGDESVSPLRFNPLEVPSGCSVDEHIAQLMACFAGAIELTGPLPAILQEALIVVYDRHGLDGEDRGEDATTTPVMDELVDTVREVMAAKKYQGDVRDTVETALITRLVPMVEGGVGRMFRAERSSPSMNELLACPTVIEMQALNQDQQNLLTLFLLTAMQRAVRSRGPSRGLRNLLVLEEAHNLVGVGTGHQDNGSADPRTHATRLVVKLLAEIRGAGTGVVVVDQTPAAVAPEVLKNTGTKIVGLTVDQEDRDRMAGGMTLDDASSRDLAHLRAGEAYVSMGSSLYRPVKVAIRAHQASSGNAISDAGLRSVLARQEWYRAMAGRILTSGLDRLLGALREYLATEVRLLRAKGGSWTVTDAHRVKQAVERAQRRMGRRLAAYLADFDEAEARELAGLYQVRFAALVRRAADHLTSRVRD